MLLLLALFVAFPRGEKGIWWDGVKRMRWYDMGWDGVKGNRMGWDGVRGMVLDGMIWYGVKGNRMGWSERKGDD